MKRLALVIPWRESGRWLWEFLPPGYAGDLLFAGPGPRHLPPYLRELVTLAALRPRWQAYDTVFTWELRAALATGLLLKLSGRQKPAFVPIGPILKGLLRHPLALRAIRWLLADAARIVCFSRVECESYARLLCLPRERFVFLPTPWRSDETLSTRDDGFILAMGTSNRDFSTLIEAVRGTDLPVLIVTGDRRTLGNAEIPPNVETRDNVGPDEASALIANATFHCIPLHEADYSAGQSVLLRAMARGKAVVVTDTAGIRDYVTDAETALLSPPGNVEALRDSLSELWHDADARRWIGINAMREVKERFGFERFVAELTLLAEEACEKPA